VAAQRRPRGYRYGPWRGGRDPLAPPFDARAAVDAIGADVMGGSNVRSAVERLLRRGMSGREGLDALRERLRKRRAEVGQRGNLSGTLDQVRAALDQALASERAELAARDDDAARLSEMSLDTVPDDTATAVRELDGYDWQSDKARQIFASIKQLLRTEILDAQFAGMKQALSGDDAETMARVRDMIADLNQLLADHAAGHDTTEQFEQFMEQHGEFFPEQPRDTDDLIDILARRQAAAERLMRSLSPDQRRELGELMAGAAGDLDLQSQLSQLQDNLHALRPGMIRARGPADIDGDQGLGYGDAVGAVADLADLEQLEAQLSQDYGGANLDDVDVDALERQLSPAAVRDLRGLRELERELERQGYLQREAGELTLTPKALRRMGQSALVKVFERLDSANTGHHRQYRPGKADDRTGVTLPWHFGDERPIDPTSTVRKAVLRQAASGVGSSTSVALLPEDFCVAETEDRTTAAVALCVDLSFSMVQEDRWAPMKQTALALSHLVSTRFRSDALEIIGFSRMARRLTAGELAAVEPSWEQGTNLQHALVLAGRHVRRHPGAEPVVLVVTDGEPTAHLDADGTAYFSWPTTHETLRATMGEVDAMTRMRATMNFFLLGDDPGLARFTNAIARRNGGRVFTPELGQLGEYVVADYLRARRG